MERPSLRVTALRRFNANNDDTFSFSEDGINSDVISLDVLANDPHRFQLHAVGSFTGDNASTGSQLLGADPAGVWDTVTDANGQPVALQIVDNQIQLDLQAWLGAYGHSSTEALGEGETLQVQIAYAIADPTGGTPLGWNLVTLTLTGSNDAPTITVAQVQGDVFESAAPVLMATGLITVSDADTFDTLSAVVGNEVVDGDGSPIDAPLGQLTLGAVDRATGALTWTFAVDDTSVEFLRAGETRTQVYTVTVSDNHGGSVQQAVTITLHGTNHAPVITSDAQIAQAIEDRHSLLNVQGRLETADTNNPTRTGTYKDDYPLSGWIAGVPVTIALDAPFDTFLQVVEASSGSVIKFDDDSGPGLNSLLTFTPAEGEQYLARATSYATGITGPYTLTATDETPTEVLTGRVTASDVDPGDVLTYSTADTARYGTFTVDATSGEWRYELDNTRTAVQSLAEGELGSETLTVMVADGQGGIASQDVIVTLRGTNDAPVIVSGAQTGTATENGHPFLSVQGSLDTSDAANPTRVGRYKDDHALTGLIAGQPAMVNLDAAFDAYLQIIDAATGAVVAFNDQSNSTNNSQVIFRPQAGVEYLARVTSYLSNATGEYSLTAAVPDVFGQVIASDRDAGDRVTYSATTTPRFGTFTLDATTGQWSYLVNDRKTAVQSTPEGGTLTETITVIASDEKGGTATEVVTITINGANDPPVITSALQTGTVTEDGSHLLAESGSLDVTDATNPARTGRFKDDYLLTGWTAGEPVTVSMGGGFDTYLQIINRATGSVVTFDDDSGPGTDSALTFTPQVGIEYLVRATSYYANVSGAYSLTATSAGSTTIASGRIAVSDVDAGDVLTYSTDSTGRYGTFTLGSTSGNWQYILSNDQPVVQSLAAGETAFDTFMVTVTDRSGATASQNVTLTIRGTNDTPEARGDFTGSILYGLNQGDTPSTSGQIIVTDADAGQSGLIAFSANGSYGELTVEENGHWTYLLNPAYLPESFDQPLQDSFNTLTTLDQTLLTQALTITLLPGAMTPEAPIL